MHATRLATFLLGGWIVGCLLVGALSLQNFRVAEHVLNSPLPQADEIAKNAGIDQQRLYVHHLVSEEYRNYFRGWGLVQLLLGFVTLGTVYFATDRRILGPILVGLMLVMVLFQVFAIAPELTYRGRETDFPPGSQAFGAAARHWAIMQVYIGVEAAKLLIGGILTSYILAYKSRVRAKSKHDAALDTRLDTRMTGIRP